MKKFKLFIYISILLSAYTLNYATYFYLSTEKSFMESENARIKIESHSTPYVNARLYKIPDPEAFIKTKKNINRVFIESEYIKKNPTELLFRYLNIFKSSLREYAREKILEDKTRENAAEIYRDMLSPQTVKRNIVIGKIEKYELIKEFKKNLDSTSSWSYTYIDFGNLKRGLYLSEVFSEDSIAYTMIHVSDIAIIVKKSDTTLLIQSLDKQTGIGVKTEISIYDFESGKIIGNGKTTEEGIFRFNLQKNKYSELLVYSKSKDDFTFYKVSFYPVAKVERLVYLYTDSPIYKYGNKVHIKGIVRDFKNSVYSTPEIGNVKIYIVNPRGDQINLPDTKLGDFGTFETEYEIGENFPTGIYKVVATIDEKSYVGEFKVEDYVKPQFKVTVASDQKVVVGNQTVKIKIKADYFTGNAVSGADVTYSIFKTPLREDIFESERDIFEDPSYSSKIEFLDSKSSTLDSKGEFEFSFSPSKYNVDRDYAFIIKAQVSDKSMSRGTGSTKVKVVRAEFFMRAEVAKSVYIQGEEIRASVKLIYPDGSPVVKKSVSYQAILEENSRVISEGTLLSDDKGNANISFKATGKGFLRIKISTKDSFGNTVEENVYTWIGQEGGTFVYTSGDITIVFDKDEYYIGGKAKVLIVSPVSHAQALITTEREDIFTYSLKKFKGNTLLMDLPITKEYTPNFYFSVLFVFNNEVYENSVKVKVPPLDKILSLKIKPDKSVYSPREKGKIAIEVKDNKGNPVEAELSVSVVNEALYQLSPEIFPDIRLYFYAYRWNSVTTMNSIALRFYGYSRIIKEKFALNYYKKKIWDFEDFLNTQNTAYTGIKEAEEEKQEERIIFKDQILWEGKIKTDEKGEAIVNIDFPDNLTEWRIVAVAITKDTRVGKQVASVRTFKDMFVDLNLPENMGLFDKVKGFIKIFNNSRKERTISLKMTAENGKLDFATQEITIPANKEKILSFPFLPTSVGKARIRAEAVSKEKKDVLVQEFNILPVSLEKIYTDVKVIQSPNDLLKFRIPESALPGSIDISIGLAEIENPFGILVGGLRYLKSYPYGCVEQTTSSFLPNLIAFEISKKLKINLPSEFNDKDIIMEKGLNALYSYKNSDGGWGWWNEGSSDMFMTAYVLYAMSFVKKNYPEKLNKEIFEDGIRALESMVKTKYKDDNSQIYALYVLSECGSYFKSMIEKLAEKDNKSPFFLSLLAMAAKNSGLNKVAQDVANKIDNMCIPQNTGAYWKFSDHYWYGAEIIATSVAIRALIIAKPDSKNIDKGIIYLITKRYGNRWRSTRETAEALYAIGEFVSSKAFAKVKAETVDVYLDSKKIDTLTFSGNIYRNIVRLPDEAFTKNVEHKVSFGVNSGFYVADVRLKYNTDDKNVEKESQGLSINRKYYKVINRSNLSELGGNPSVNIGDVILVELQADSKNNLEFVVLEDGLPAGFLPITKVNEYNLGIDFYKNTAHTEFGHGKYTLFLKRFINGKYYYLMQAAYPGSFYALPSVGYEMYRPENRGNTESSIIEVKE